MDIFNHIDSENVGGSVAIVGGGIAGITSCKSALECGLQPTVFEKSSKFGGTWSPNSGYAWSTLKTFISKYMFMFSDFPFKKNVPLYPNTVEVYQYLQDYINHNNLYNHFKFNSTVLDVRQTKNDKWVVEWTENGKVNRKRYEFVIIASGFFSEPTSSTESLKEIENFTGGISFGNDYKNSESFKGKRVAVVGNSFTGCEIASDLTKNNDKDNKILHVVYRINWILERNFQFQNKSNLPCEFLCTSRELNSKYQKLNTDQKNRDKYQFLKKMSGKQPYCPELKVDASPKDPQLKVISDGYVDNVNDMKIMVRKRTSIVNIVGKTIFFKNFQKDGSESIEEHEIDNIILCTGYKLKLPFFKQNILDQLYFDENDKYQPIVIFKNVFSPNLKNLGFVGILKGGNISLLELQSRWVSMVFSGIVKFPSNEEMIASIQNELENRKSYPKEQCPHGELIQICEDIAKEIGVQPDYERIKSSDPVLYKQLWNNFLSPSSWRLIGFKSDPKFAREHLMEIDKLFY
eukprot:gene5746-7148_t